MPKQKKSVDEMFRTPIAKPVEDVVEQDNKVVEQDEETEGYVVPEGEEDLYHVELCDKIQFDPITGKRVAKPFVQKYNAKIWATIYDALTKQGYNMTILHDPTKKK